MTTSILAIVNRLLPFATPGTPLVQDLAHLFAICIVLYLAPTLQERYARRSVQPLDNAADAEDTIRHDTEVRHDDANDLDQPDDQIAREAVAEGPGIDRVPDQADFAQDDGADPQEGPAGGQHHMPAQRNIGAKKAKSLAKKDQRKAYHEFMRSQGDAQRARDAEGAAERDAALEAERKRRAQAEAELDAKRAREREVKREAEKADREAEFNRREAAVALVKANLAASNVSDLHKVAVLVGGDVDVEWVEKVINASGLTGRRGDVLTKITSTGWAVRISQAQAAQLYEQAASSDINDDEGSIDTQQISRLFVSVLQESVVI